MMSSLSSSSSFVSSLIIVVKSSCLIPLFINASDILLSMIFNLLLAKIIILLYFFFLFRVVFNNFFTMPIDIENARPKLAFAIPTGAPIIIANDAIKMLPLVANKTMIKIKFYQNNQKKQDIY